MIDGNLKENLNQTVFDKFNDAENGSWKEDEITSAVLKTIKNTIKKVNFFNDVKWNICKYNGKLENTFGDIAFTIKIYFTQDKYIEGVYFIEAKRFYFDTNNYKSIKFENLKNYIEYSQSHSVILYNITKDVLENDQNILTLPTQHLITLDENSKNIENFTEHFENLLNDLFKGKNLDYREKQVNDAKGFVSNTGKKFKYIITTAFALNQNIDVKLSEVNNNFYKSIDNVDTEQKRNNGYSGPSFRM